MDRESDGSLFTYIAFIETDPVEGNAALAELMWRYQAMLLRRCNWMCASYPSLGYTGDELVSDTFHKVMRRASTYTPIQSLDATPDDRIKYTGAWLCRISQRLLLDAEREAARPAPFERTVSEPAPLDSIDVAALFVDGNPGRLESRDKPLVAEAFQELSERERIVIVWTLDKRLRSPSGAYMSRGSASELARRLDTTSDNIRQIRKRAFDRLFRSVATLRKARRRHK